MRTTRLALPLALWLGACLLAPPAADGASLADTAYGKRGGRIAEWVLSPDGTTLALSPDRKRLYLVDTRGGAATLRASLPPDTLMQPAQLVLSRLLSPDLAQLLTPEADYTKPVVTRLADGSQRPVTALKDTYSILLGFTGPHTYLAYFLLQPAQPPKGRGTPGNLSLVDLDTGQVAWSVRATKSEWIPPGESDGACALCLGQAIARGVYSPARDYFAYLVHNSLHVLQTQTGKLQILDDPAFQQQAAANPREPFFSAEGDTLAVPIPGAGNSLDLWLYDLPGGTHRKLTLPIWAQSRLLYLSTRRGLVTLVSANQLVEFSLGDLSRPRWITAASTAKNPLAVSADGQLAFLADGSYLKLDPLRAGAPPDYRPLPATLQTGPAQRPLVAPGLVILQAMPEMQIWRTDTADGTPQILAQLDLRDVIARIAVGK